MAAILRYQLELFLLAVSFFSRIPVPVSLPYSSERMNQAGRYFALVGLLLGRFALWFTRSRRSFFLPTSACF